MNAHDAHSRFLIFAECRRQKAHKLRHERTKNNCGCLAGGHLAVFMIYLPKCAGKMLERDQYREWLEPEEEEFSGVINVWHVVGFKPYSRAV